MKSSECDICKSKSKLKMKEGFTLCDICINLYMGFTRYGDHKRLNSRAWIRATSRNTRMLLREIKKLLGGAKK